MLIIRMTDPKMATYTGYMGLVDFDNGVSREPVGRLEMNRIASIIGIEAQLPDGEWVGVGPAQDLLTWMNERAAVETSRRAPADTTPPPAEITPEPMIINETDPAAISPEDELDKLVEKSIADSAAALSAEFEKIDQARTDVDLPPIPAREELEMIADAEGIKGLRVIADPYGIKGTRIADLIDALVAEALARVAAPDVPAESI